MSSRLGFSVSHSVGTIFIATVFSLQIAQVGFASPDDLEPKKKKEWSIGSALKNLFFSSSTPKKKKKSAVNEPLPPVAHSQQTNLDTQVPPPFERPASLVTRYDPKTGRFYTFDAVHAQITGDKPASEKRIPPPLPERVNKVTPETDQAILSEVTVSDVPLPPNSASAISETPHSVPLPPPVSPIASHDFEDLEELVKGELTPTSRALRDRMVSEWLNYISTRFKVAFIAFGSPDLERKLTSREKTALIEVTRSMLSRGYTVIYDLNTTIGRAFSEEITSSPVQDRAGVMVGLGSSWNEIQHLRNAVAIENPYIRMQAILNLKNLVFTPDSLLGLGLMMQGYKDHPNLILYDYTIDWKNGLHAWSSDLNIKQYRKKFCWKFDPASNSVTCEEEFQNLGVEFTKHGAVNHVYAPYSVMNELMGQHLPELRHDFEIDFKVLPILADLKNSSTKLTKRLLQEAQADVEVQQKLASAMDAKSGNLAAVFFGGAKEYRGFLQNTSQVLISTFDQGITSVATGGGAGFMRLASEIARAKKIPTVAITHKAIDFERVGISQDVAVVETGDYDQRIPLLLHNKRVVIIGPGGPGTMREIATTFVKIAGTFNDIPQLIFTDNDYYSPLVEWMLKLNLPAKFKDKLKLQTPGQTIVIEQSIQ